MADLATTGRPDDGRRPQSPLGHDRRCIGLLPLLLLGFALTPCPAGAFFSDADVSSILVNRDRAARFDAPIVLLAHDTHVRLLGNGPRRTEEHLLWYVREPDAPATQAIRRPRIRIGQRLERFILQRCRIYRGADTLGVPPEAWKLAAISGWPPAAYRSWSEATAELPALRRGDVVEIAYAIDNQWSQRRQASHWTAIPLPHPEAPTLERHIVLNHPAALEGRARVFGAATTVIRHYGAEEPEWEILTGNLPPSGMGQVPPRMLFASDTPWSTVHRSLGPHYRHGARRCAESLAAVGDSLLTAARPTRARLAAVLEYVENHWQRVPRPLRTSDFYPRSPEEILNQRTADRLDRAMLVMGLGQAAKLQIEVFLAASTEEGFRPEFASPQQFDRVLVGTPVIEEGRFLLIDPWAGELTSAEKAARLPLLFGITEAVAGFREVTDDGQLISRSFP